MATQAKKPAINTPETRELLDDALHHLEQVLVAIGQDQEPNHAKRARCPQCIGELSIEACPAERRFHAARDVVKRGKERS